jgi:hypothetical protein
LSILRSAAAGASLRPVEALLALTGLRTASPRFTICALRQEKALKKTKYRGRPA